MAVRTDDGVPSGRDEEQADVLVVTSLPFGQSLEADVEEMYRLVTPPLNAFHGT
jgi:hypothetical protein